MMMMTRKSDLLCDRATEMIRDWHTSMLGNIKMFLRCHLFGEWFTKCTLPLSFIVLNCLREDDVTVLTVTAAVSK